MIPVIKGVNIEIKDIKIDAITTYRYTPPSVPNAPPVTVDIGVPIVNIPGCVEAHEQNTSKERSGILSEDDPKGVKTFCDAGVPSFNPIDYNKDKLDFDYEQPVPPVRSPEQPKTETPETKTPVTPRPECPTREQQLKNPVGKILEGNKKITGYEVVGKECLMVTEKLDIVDQIVGNIPNAGAVTATASIAVVATTSALLAKPLADLLLKVVKPTVKKVIKKIAAIRGKTVKVESLKERQGQQRIRNKAIRTLKGRE
jgi:hypothetical protein|tara:strand:- start:611 stop:1381 length:771 start_codon:yes stop_codon:yes gene_type:complete